MLPMGRIGPQVCPETCLRTACKVDHGDHLKGGGRVKNFRGPLYYGLESCVVTPPSNAAFSHLLLAPHLVKNLRF